MDLESPIFLIIWVSMVLWVTYGFLWGDGAHKAFDISSKLFKGFFFPAKLRDKDTFTLFARVFAIIFFFFNALILVLIFLIKE